MSRVKCWRAHRVDVTTFETAGKQLGIIAGVLGSLLVIWKAVINPIRCWLLRCKVRNDAVKALTIAVEELRKNIVDLDSKIDSAHKADMTIRRSLYHGQIATISALREMAEHQGLKINGPVELYYKQNIEALKTELDLNNQ